MATSPEAYAAARVFFGLASAIVPGGWVVRGLAAANAADEVSTGLQQFRDPEAKSVKARSGEAGARALGADESTARSVGAAADVLVPVGIGVASVVGVGLRATSASLGRAIGDAVDDAFAGTAKAVDDLAPRVSTAAEGGGGPQLFRGVPGPHTARGKLGQQGIAQPRGTALDEASLRRHVLGEDVDAGVTSWSTSRAQAKRFSGSEGTIIEVDAAEVADRVLPRPDVEKYGDELEVLLRGWIAGKPTKP